MTFEPTGDIDLDLAAFFVGVGQTEMLDRYRKLKLPIRGLAAQILDNHQEELTRIRQGEEPLWGGKFFRRSPETLKVYQQILEQEDGVLTAVLKQDEQRKAA